MKLYIALFFVSCLTAAQIGSAQERLSIEDAVGIALKNNYQIKIETNNAEIAKNNVNIGNAGFLPSLSGDLNTGGGISNSTQVQQTGVERKVNGARNSNFNYGVSLGWTLFDGFQMFTNYEKLKEFQKQGELNVRTSMLNTIADVVTGYYELAKQQKLLKATDSTLKISRFRLKLSENKLEIGKGSKLDVLTAQVDFNADTSAYLQQKNTARILMINLNRILARDPNINFSVNEELDLNANLNYAELASKTEELNPEIQMALITNKIAELNLKQIKGKRLPVVNLNSGYNINKSNTPTGFNQSLRSNGLTYGLSASVNIFNGFLQRQNERNAKINITSAELSLAEAKDKIQANLATAYQSYSTALDVLKLEKGNVDIAKQNLDITLEKYRLGSISTLDVRDAQVSYINAVNRFVNAEFQAKLNEISLKEISGTLNFQ